MKREGQEERQDARQQERQEAGQEARQVVTSGGTSEIAHMWATLF